MAKVKSTYNFVPAPTENEVFKPNWADRVSHDIPFSDGESGEIELKITAKTPIFIRNGHTKEDADSENDNYLSFSHRLKADGTKEYFIPATSLKGMVRNVLEILSRSRMAKVNNHRHSVRQIMKTKDTVVDEGYELSGEEKRNIYAGWLIQDGENYFIADCGKPLKIRYTDLDDEIRLDDEFSTSFEQEFGAELASEINTNFSARTARYKYENVLNGISLIRQFEIHPLDEEGQSSWVSQFQPLGYARFAIDSSESFVGTIVCVGQATDYTVSTARKGEYVFRGDKVELIKSGRRLKVSSEIMEDFRFINRHNTSEELEDWAYWKNEIKEGIPVFFRKFKEGNNVKDLGLSFMYKQPAKYSVKESYPLKTYADENDKNYQLDWAETMFGCAYKEKVLKGRILFSNAFLKGEVNELPEQRVVLSTPRSSFFPFYLKQNGRNGRTLKYNTYNTTDYIPTLSGFKRYPVRNEKQDMNIEGMNPEMITTFKPLDENSIFTAKLRFHNLRKSEIGALISALTFHKTEGEFYHNIGYAKTLGYGKVQIEIQVNKFNHDQTEYLKAFEYEMTRNDDNWHGSEISKELLAMASDSNERQLEILEYLDVTEFQGVKNDGYYLESYSVLANSQAELKKQLSNTERNEQRRTEELENQRVIVLKEQKRKEQVALQKREELADFNQAIEAKTIEALEVFKLKYPSSKYNEQVLEHTALLRQKAKIQKAENAQAEKFQSNSFFFREIKKWPSEKLKNKYFEFSDSQKDQIESAVRKSFDLENQKPKKSSFYKKRKMAQFKDFPWSQISKWLGEDRTKTLYTALTGKEV